MCADEPGAFVVLKKWRKALTDPLNVWLYLHRWQEHTVQTFNFKVRTTKLSGISASVSE